MFLYPQEILMQPLTFVILFVLFFPSILMGQVTQGGPPDDQLRETNVVNWGIDNASIILVMDLKAEKLVPHLEKALNKCILAKKRSVKVKDISEYYQIFLSENYFESFRKIEKEVSGDKKAASTLIESSCYEKDDHKRKCMQDQVDQVLLKDFLESSVVGRYLELKLKLNTKDSLTLLKAIQELEKK